MTRLLPLEFLKWLVAHAPKHAADTIQEVLPEVDEEDDNHSLSSSGDTELVTSIISTDIDFRSKSPTTIRTTPVSEPLRTPSPPVHWSGLPVSVT